MKKNKKPWTAWTGEAVLIFLSIMLAFYFENYREQRSRQTAYINQLKDFHFDLKRNQGAMKFDLREPDGAIQDNFDVYDSLLRLIAAKDKSLLTETITMLQRAEQPLAKWFFQSPLLDQLMTDHYAIIKNVELKRTMSIHKRRMQFIDQFKDEMKSITEKLHPYYDRLDLNNLESNYNLQVLDDNELSNLILRLDRKVWQIKGQYIMAKSRDSLICLEIEKELSLWNEEL